MERSCRTYSWGVCVEHMGTVLICFPSGQGLLGLAQRTVHKRLGFWSANFFVFLCISLYLFVGRNWLVTVLIVSLRFAYSCCLGFAVSDMFWGTDDIWYSWKQSSYSRKPIPIPFHENQGSYERHRGVMKLWMPIHNHHLARFYWLL